MNLSFSQEYPWGGATNFQAKILAFFGVEPYADSFKPKKHTFREDMNERWEAGKSIHYHHGGRRLKYFCWHKGICTGTQIVQIFWKDVKKEGDFPAVYVDARRLTIEKITMLAENDGFDNVADFFRWFNKDFRGRLIHWSDVRY